MVHLLCLLIAMRSNSIQMNQLFSSPNPASLARGAEANMQGQKVSFLKEHPQLCPLEFTIAERQFMTKNQAAARAGGLKSDFWP